ncbi:C4-dicarboxylate TRAP transporter substrate-binding protein [bacterium]|nr:C4-dicarboxylate TRAP transporter substrate-binding protein [bacterium]
MKKASVFKKFLVMSCVMATVVLFSSVSFAKTYRWVMGAGHPSTALGGLNEFKEWFAPELAKRIKAATGDDVNWVFAFGGAIAKVGDELEALEQGTLTFGPVQYPFEWAKLPMGGVFYQLPFSSTDMKLMQEIAYKLHKDVPYMWKALEKNNVKYIGHMGWDSYQLITTFPITSLDDFKNRKIAGAGPNLEWIKAVGAVPVQANLTEVYTSLQTGVFEGYLAAVSWMYGFKFYEVAKYTTLCDFGAVPGTAFGVNMDEFDSLPKKIQDIILQTGSELHGRVAARGEGDLQNAIKVLKDNNVKFYQMTYDQKKQWAEMMPNIPGKFIETYEAKGIPARQIVKFVIDEQKKAGYIFPRDWEKDIQ